ncbi:hypothetical protein PR048_019424 [Dryococelus australis]|uniref:Endonuclease/exonuclease/phosphatase domain-containing protein n=1 Tax=Dryococelus australis TaxID=614101 RepID=A0ABQ9H3G0_9NEOP|nr:hypothetical protein PR048_019424 [Dryococelus australis]
MTPGGMDRILDNLHDTELVISVTDKKGTEVEQFITARDLRVCNCHEQMATYVSPSQDTESFIGVTVATSWVFRKIHEWVVAEESLSDHRLILYEFDNILLAGNKILESIKDPLEKRVEIERVIVEACDQALKKREQLPEERQCLAEDDCRERNKYFASVRRRKLDYWRKMIEEHGNEDT